MTAQTITKRDSDFFEAVYELMKASFPEMIEKFGIWRIHQHFDVKIDEVFHETSDAETKESTLKIIKKADLPETAIATTWILSDQGPLVANWCCDINAN